MATETIALHQVHLDGFGVKATKDGDVITAKLSMPYNPETMSSLMALQGRVFGYLIRALPELMGAMTDPEIGEIVYRDDNS